MKAVALSCVAWIAATALSRPVVGADSSMLPPHPRLLLNDSSLSNLRSRIVGTDSTLASYYQDVLKAGKSIVASQPIAYPNCTVVGSCRNTAIFGSNASYINAGGLQTTILTTALLHRLAIDNSSDWAGRAIAEMLNAASFPSWYWPVGQALERAEMAFGIAVGYDWLYDVLTAQQKQVLEDAMGQLVLVMRARDERQGMWWTQDIYNWNINSNAPLLAVTLALGDVPKWSDLAAQVQGIVLSNVPNAIASFAPDGVWPEGPSYQGYTAGSLIHGAAALLSATGDDAGWMSAPGICSSGLASMYQTGPSGTYFNFADAHPGTPVTSTLFYLSGTPGCAQYQSIYAAAARSYRSLSPGSAAAEDVMWYSPAGDNSSVPSLPLAAVYADPSLDNSKGAKTHFGSFRSSWSDSNATWVSFKGGQNHFDDHGSDSHNNHGHLDVGNFVLESQGVRWAIDVGPGQYDYPLLAYFGRFRFGYAFVSSETHNVLQFDDDTQHRRGEGRIVATNVGPVPASAAADTPPEASGDAGTKLRGAASPAVATKLDLKAEVPVSMDRATSRGSYGSDALSTSGSSASALRSFSSSDISSPWATVDTSSAYGGSAFVMRNVSMAMAGDAANGGIVTVADTWLHPTASNATFKLHTTQSVSIQGSGAGAYVVLTAPGGVSMKVEASTAAIGVVPAWSTFVLNLAYPQTDTYANLPINVLYATVPASAGSLSVTFTPV